MVRSIASGAGEHGEMQSSATSTVRVGCLRQRRPVVASYLRLSHSQKEPQKEPRRGLKYSAPSARAGRAGLAGLPDPCRSSLGKFVRLDPVIPVIPVVPPQQLSAVIIETAQIRFLGNRHSWSSALTARTYQYLSTACSHQSLVLVAGRSRQRKQARETATEYTRPSTANHDIVSRVGQTARAVVDGREFSRKSRKRRKSRKT